MTMSYESVFSLQRWGRDVLRKAAVATPELDARLLLQHSTGLSHIDLIADPDRLVAPEKFRAAIGRRSAHEPVSRIIGMREFYGRPFRVTPATLDPRPDTETLIAEALSHEFASFVDAGTGTGAIGLTLLAERPGVRGLLTDISPAALAVAKANALALNLGDRASFLQTSWLDGLGALFDMVISNPPYIPHADIAGLEVDVRQFDPELALVGGDDGLDAYRALAGRAKDVLRPDGLVCVEVGMGQGESVRQIFRAAGFAAVGQRRDLGGHERVFSFRASEK